MVKVNLRAYAEAATLPPYTEAESLTLDLALVDPDCLKMPLRGANLTLGWRRLRIMPRLKSENVNAKVNQYWDHRFSDKYMDLPLRELDKYLGIPVAQYFTVQRNGWSIVDHRYADLYEVGRPESLSRLTEKTVLWTAAALLHVGDEKTKEWTVEKEGGRSGGRAADPMCLAKWQFRIDSRSDMRVGIIFIPPWQFLLVDLAEFIDGTNVSQWFNQSAAAPSNHTDHESSNAQLLWARIYDYCYSGGCYHWLVTTYEYWVFGMFSKDHACGWTTEIYGKDSKDPTILQLVVYWMHSAFEAENTLPLPAKPEAEDTRSDESPCHSGRLWATNPKAVMEILSLP
ncbi:hypothetical protein BD410DRAFT_790582 [Rickenella mellea]|uniref:Uncharacterized protein n=1 Tax=Rickenella mellea TaxID=50990 RepID=A0A4Y7Q0D5_9AGAM|nr:hypothetical protein BD410DRAFT_790582 [Rickenella mellea]